MTSASHHDHYAILGVDPDATDAQITHAYRVLLRRHHPDTRDVAATDGDQAATEDTRLQYVLAAYTVLHDPRRRADYDRYRRPPAPLHGRTRATPGGSTVILGTITTTRPTGLTPVEPADTPPPATTVLDLLLRAIFEPPC
jgi:DnaJ-class molecular chaperone